MRNIKKKNIQDLKLLFLVIFIVFLSIRAILFKLPVIKNQIREDSVLYELETPRLSFVTTWIDNGTAICTANDDQEFPQIVNNGFGGVIAVWDDWRSGNYDIYAQQINSSGDSQWLANGIVICNAANNQRFPKIINDGTGGAIIVWTDVRSDPTGDIYVQLVNSSGISQWTANGILICNAYTSQDPQIISDGAGGAIISWQDKRDGTFNIYAQRINSTGDVQWTVNGIAICNAVNEQQEPKMISDGVGGAIITWHDLRNGNLDIYAQRVNSSGDVQWTPNGVAICTLDNIQREPQITTDGAGGAIITWVDIITIYRDIYIQKINSNGITQWTPNGTSICTASDNQQSPEIINDGAGGAKVTWYDERSGNYDIYAQWVDFNGTTQWITDGIAICTEVNHQFFPQIVDDGASGAIVTWFDERSGNYDIFAQRINISGDVQWTANGVSICTMDNDQRNPVIINSGTGSAIIAWQDWRDGNYDIYAQRIDSTLDLIPTSNHPQDITTSFGRSETIDWILYDDFGGGKYRVLANNTIGNYYVWINWTSWSNNSVLNIPINRTTVGIYNFTIEYYDDHNQSGIPDTVIVTITTDSLPVSNHPEAITTLTTGSETIDWILYDDFGEGKYRVLANNTVGNYYVWINWTPWSNNSVLNIPINRTTVGIYNYTIEYYDDQNQYGTPNAVIVRINLSSNGNQDLNGGGMLTLIIIISLAIVSIGLVFYFLVFRPRINKKVKPKISEVEIKEGSDLEEEISKASKELENFKITTKNFIQTNLEQYYGDNWWKLGIPEDIKNNIASKIKTFQENYPEIEYKRIDLLEFNKYFGVISEQNNWDKIFSKVFSDKENLEKNFLNLGIFRNNLSKKTVTPEELSYFSTYINEIMIYFTKTIPMIQEKIIFLSYSTLDSNYFKIPKIAEALEKYTEITKVAYWELDSGESVVEYMERTLKKCNVFILFCSENSMKSESVKGEWQAAYQLRKKGLMKIIPIYINEEEIPALLTPLLSVKFTEDNFESFIENLYKEILRDIETSL